MSSTENSGIEKSRAGKFLTFELADTAYAFEICKVREINIMLEITRVPRTPGFVRGVMNLRGKIVPVLDLRLIFGQQQAEDTAETRIIVVEVGPFETGVVVDRMLEVVDFSDDQVEAGPSFGSNLNTSFILGMGKVQERVTILLDVDEILETEQQVILQEVAEGLPVPERG